MKIRNFAIPALLVSFSAPAEAAWLFQTLRSPMLNGGDVAMVRLANDQGEIKIKCDVAGRNSLHMIVAPRQGIALLKSNGFRPMKYRIDGGAERTASVLYDGDGITAVNLDRSLSSGKLLAGIANARKLTLEPTVTDGGRHFMAFQVEGARAAIGQVARACMDTHWTKAWRP